MTAQIRLGSGEARGQRCYRLSDLVSLPPALHFHGALPIEGDGEGRVRFELPVSEATVIDVRTRLLFDPEHPERGSTAELLSLTAAELDAITRYIDEP